MEDVLFYNVFEDEAVSVGVDLDADSVSEVSAVFDVSESEVSEFEVRIRFFRIRTVSVFYSLS